VVDGTLALVNDVLDPLPAVQLAKVLFSAFVVSLTKTTFQSPELTLSSDISAVGDTEPRSNILFNSVDAREESGVIDFI